MSRRPRRNAHRPSRSKVALASAVKGDRTIAQLAEYFDVHPNQIPAWKSRQGAALARFSDLGAGHRPSRSMKSLHAKIGELTLENDF